MQGRIYTEQKCVLCAGPFKHDANRGGLFCKVHPEQRANGQFIVRFSRGLTKRFKSYLEAERFLVGLRYKNDEGTFDARDYKKDNPLGFETLALKWLGMKEQELCYGSFKGIRRCIEQAVETWGQRNIKTIKYGDLEDFLRGLKMSDKTRYNFRSHLHQFFTWLAKREEGYVPPQVPEVKFTLGMRTIISKADQQNIIDEVKRIAPFKVWLGIRWLSIYVKMRPVEMMRLLEKGVNVGGFLILPPATTKERKPKFIPLLPEDVALVESCQKGFPDQPFFRHDSVKGHKPGTPYHPNYLYKWWKRACGNLGIEGVDMYGGTRHSTVTALSSHFSRDEIKDFGTGHDTSKAFERYFQAEAKVSLDIYRQAAQRGAEQHPNNIISLDKFRNIAK